MAKRPADEDDDDLIKVRKRRYKPKKEEDDEDAPPPGRGRGRPVDDDDEDDEDSISTGNMYLDITLDFFDDCVDWSKSHLVYAIIIATVALLIFGTLSFLTINSIVRYVTRPSLEKVIRAHDLGLHPETKLLADHALLYISPRNRPEARAPFLFLQGAALVAIADRMPPHRQREHYLMAANFLQEAAIYNFLPSRADQGWFLLGKSLFHIGELEQSREPFERALDEGYPHTKEAHWYLANAYFLGASPDLRLARHYLRLFQHEPTVLEEEIAESRILETMIALHLDGIAEAERILAQVPHLRQLDFLRIYAEGQLDFFRARAMAQVAVNLRNDPNPSLLRYAAPDLPPPFRTEPSEPEPPVESPPIELPPVELPPIELPVAPAPVSPMDEALLRQLMPPSAPPAAVLGVYDSSSEIQHWFAEMRSRYAAEMGMNDVIVLPRGTAPTPPPPPDVIEIPPFGGDLLMQRIQEYRNVAAAYYQRAIEQFNEVVRRGGIHNPWGRTARLLIGLCYMEMNQLGMDTAREADSHFRNLIRTFPGSSEAITAAFLLGEHHRMQGNTDVAFRAFAHAFNGLRQNPTYASHWLPKEMILERCTAMVLSDIERQNYADAIRLLEMLSGVMPSANRARLMGETYESWGTMLQRQAEATFGEAGEQLAEEARAMWRNAGTAFAALAQIVSDTLEFSELLWRSAENYRVGNDYRRAVVEYRKFIRASGRARRPEVNLRLGEMYLHLDILDEAAYVLGEGLRDHPRHYLVPQIRLVLSHVLREQGNWEQAMALLRLNLIGDDAPSSAPYRDSMFELGKISYYDQRDLDAAIAYFEDALRVHPQANQAAEANYLLARAYWKQAIDMLDELADDVLANVRRSVEIAAQGSKHQALLYLERAGTILTDRLQTTGLTGAERLMLRNVHFDICAILVQMEQYEQAISRLTTIATMYQGSPDALPALVKKSSALLKVGRDTESLTALRQAEVILNQLEQMDMIDNGEEWRNVIHGQMRR